jgi:hypothetical protein
LLVVAEVNVESAVFHQYTVCRSGIAEVRGGAWAFYRHPFTGVLARQGEQLLTILVIADEHSDGAHGLAIERGVLFARIHWIKIDAGVVLGTFCEMVAGINREQPDTPRS